MNRSRWVAAEALVAAAVFAVLVNRAPTMERFLVNADHGYQLAAGSELLRGRLPGVDFLMSYGPLVAVLSALTLWTTGDLVGEVLLCAAAWSAAVWLVLHFTRRNFGAAAGVAAAAAAFLSIARFHKWYMWLIPLAALAAVDASPLPSRRRWLVGGLACGVGALLRPELGVGALAVLALLGLVDTLRAGPFRLPPSWVPLAGGFAALPLAWATVVLVAAGPPGLLRSLEVIQQSLSGVVAQWSLPPPPFVFADPLSPGSAHALALRLLPVTEIGSLLLAAWLLLGRHHGLEREARALCGIGLMGLACYPHTSYRADIHHLWQGVWPLLLGVPGIGAVAARSRGGAGGHARTVATLMAVVLIVLTAAALGSLMRAPHVDLAPYGRPALAGLAELRRGLAAVPRHPYAQLVQSIDTATAPSDRIMVLPYRPQLLVFAGRGTSGFRLTYQRGPYESPRWRREHIDQLRRSPPALVVAPASFWQLAPDEELRASQPEMYDYLRTHYQAVVDQQADLMLLAPSDGARGAR